ncbi:NAD(P)H nitroreductase [Alteromonadaceae bacterium BrNp21-10]|nr:NAD(P)H nitroreductase [Alteromonadaceae bacterium BrNp21-10]
MQALDLLLNRRSHPRLKSPAPADEELANIMQAALRAPDHGSLKPWRFIVCQGLGLKELGDIFERAAIANDLSEKDIARAAELPLRAPMVIVAICKFLDHPKIPKAEQVASACCAVHAMQMAAVAQGFAGIWRTGHYTEFEDVKQAMQLDEQDEIVGYLYLGTPMTALPDKPLLDPKQFFENWD